MWQWFLNLVLKPTVLYSLLLSLAINISTVSGPDTLSISTKSKGMQTTELYKIL